MGLKSSTLLQEEDIEELQNETGCKLNAFCENLVQSYVLNHF